ncbi:putative intraflagellar transport protein 25 -like [Scophthalmus maximus]|uniref:Putative intraflagellar transport protein 25-like n=2 Tax=Scophthalmus maximus TaxID=52904 RepID=A0A2U9BTD3_SCOMX|nr:intraflagellar transport protein 25 homolog isoform X2 [Scophthalmus maximus]AWP06880.1 putative intraflagellar transport protein 25 -like [Scophthalmus maximus]
MKYTRSPGDPRNMTDSSLSSLGAKVVVASSGDENHPPENITDGTETFWMSTGMFPQEFIVRFAEATTMSAVTVDSYNVKHLRIEKTASQNASQFELVTEKEFGHTEGHLQSNVVSLNGSSATHLRFIITTGYDHFVSVHRVTVQN